MNDWPELDALCEELRQANEEQWKRTEELRQQLNSLQPHLDLIAQQFHDLQVDEHLRALNDRLLGGLGSVEIIHGGVGIEYAAGLLWPGHVHPQAEDEDAAAEDMYRIDVWLGPGLQDGRARIRIAGAKRLEAVLPTSGERFRSALLSVFRNPQRVVRPSAEEADQEPPAQEDQTTEQEDQNTKEAKAATPHDEPAETPRAESAGDSPKPGEQPTPDA